MGPRRDAAAPSAAKAVRASDGMTPVLARRYRNGRGGGGGLKPCATGNGCGGLKPCATGNSAAMDR